MNFALVSRVFKADIHLLNTNTKKELIVNLRQILLIPLLEKEVTLSKLISVFDRIKDNDSELLLGIRQLYKERIDVLLKEKRKTYGGTVKLVLESLSRKRKISKGAFDTTSLDLVKYSKKKEDTIKRKEIIEFIRKDLLKWKKLEDNEFTKIIIDFDTSISTGKQITMDNINVKNSVEIKLRIRDRQSLLDQFDDKTFQVKSDVLKVHIDGLRRSFESFIKRAADTVKLVDPSFINRTYFKDKPLKFVSEKEIEDNKFRVDKIEEVKKLINRLNRNGKKIKNKFEGTQIILFNSIIQSLENPTLQQFNEKLKANKDINNLISLKKLLNDRLTLSKQFSRKGTKDIKDDVLNERSSTLKHINSAGSWLLNKYKERKDINSIIKEYDDDAIKIKIWQVMFDSVKWIDIEQKFKDYKKKGVSDPFGVFLTGISFRINELKQKLEDRTKKANDKFSRDRSRIDALLIKEIDFILSGVTFDEKTGEFTILPIILTKKQYEERERTIKQLNDNKEYIKIFEEISSNIISPTISPSFNAQPRDVLPLLDVAKEGLKKQYKSPEFIASPLIREYDKEINKDENRRLFITVYDIPMAVALSNCINDYKYNLKFRDADTVLQDMRKKVNYSAFYESIKKVMKDYVFKSYSWTLLNKTLPVQLRYKDVMMDNSKIPLLNVFRVKSSDMIGNERVLSLFDGNGSMIEEIYVRAVRDAEEECDMKASIFTNYCKSLNKWERKNDSRYLTKKDYEVDELHLFRNVKKSKPGFFSFGSDERDHFVPDGVKGFFLGSDGKSSFVPRLFRDRKYIKTLVNDHKGNSKKRLMLSIQRMADYTATLSELQDKPKLVDLIKKQHGLLLNETIHFLHIISEEDTGRFYKNYCLSMKKGKESISPSVDDFVKETKKVDSIIIHLLQSLKN